MYRVRQVTPKITKEELLRCIPESFLSVIPNLPCNYPQFIHDKKLYSEFGFYMEYLVKKMLSKIVPTQINLDPVCLSNDGNINIMNKWNRYASLETKWEEVLYDIRDMLQITRLYNHEIDYMYTFFQNLYTYLYNYFKQSTHLTFIFNAEYNYQNISGHPDIDCLETIVEIKNTSNPTKDNLHHLKQTLAYVALKRINNLKCNYVAFIFPMQHNVTLLNVQDWNSDVYLQLLLQKTNELSILPFEPNNNLGDNTDILFSMGTTILNPNIIPNNSLDNFSNDLIFVISDLISPNGTAIKENLFSQNFEYQRELLTYPIGTHIEKAPLLLTSLQKAVSIIGKEIPFQIYLRNPENGRGKLKDDDIIHSRNYINQNNLKVFVHCALCVNLAHPFTKKEPNSDLWPIGIMIEDLKNCVNFNGKGLVIHCGNYKDFPIDVALNKFEASIRRILKYATINCPLILETASGKKNKKDLCYQFDDLVNFYSRFSIEERTRFKICVDTCHVFSAGYTPSHFIINWEKIYPNSISLVHFNDSKADFGTRVDRHEYYITYNPKIGEDLLEVAKYCSSHNIPMVTE